MSSASLWIVNQIRCGGLRIVTDLRITKKRCAAVRKLLTGSALRLIGNIRSREVLSVVSEVLSVVSGVRRRRAAGEQDEADRRGIPDTTTCTKPLEKGLWGLVSKLLTGRTSMLALWGR